MRGRRGARWVEAQDPDQTTVPEVPVEWECMYILLDFAWFLNNNKLVFVNPHRFVFVI